MLSQLISAAPINSTTVDFRQRGGMCLINQKICIVHREAADTPEMVNNITEIKDLSGWGKRMSKWILALPNV